MTDDSVPPSGQHPIQRLDVPETLLSAEWNVADLPWLTPDETPESGAAPPSGRAMPTPPSQRRGPPTEFTAGAAAPLGASGTRAPLITCLKPRQPEIEIPPSVLLAPDLGATLPPRAEREAAASPSVQSNVCSAKARRARPSFVALGTAVGCVLGYGLWIAAARPAAANAVPERPLPQFLRESSPPTAVAPAPPSALGATLAPSVPSVPSAMSDAPSRGGDAGADAAPPALLMDTPATAPKAVSAEPSRTEVLRAALEAQRRELAVAAAPVSTPQPQTPTAARHTLPSSDVGRSRKKLPVDALEPTDARAPRAPVSPALRPLTTYTYEDRALFAVATAPLRVTDISLEPGETLVSQPTAGDGARWVISVVQGGDRSHVFVKPLRPGLRTNLTLTTNRRSYFLELTCRDDGTYMAGVGWQYPADENARRREALAHAERERQSTTAVSDLQSLRFDYRIEGTSPWTPTLVFDDGTKTFIRFPRPVSPDQAPALFLLRSGSARDATYVNYRVKGDLYVIDRLVEVAELRLGSHDDDPDVVRITRQH